MTRITDRTLSCIDDQANNKSGAKSALLKFLYFLLRLDPGVIELSEKMYRILSPLPAYHYVLRIENPADAQKYPQIVEFVCRNTKTDSKNIRTEILLDNNIKNLDEKLTHFCSYANVRIQGLDNIMCEDFVRVFAQLKETLGAEYIEFCPRNHFNCAAALAVEWILCGTGGNVVTSFSGIGGFAPTEEVLMFLCENSLRAEKNTYDFFPEMTRLFHKLTKKNVPANKPIIGDKIFHIESGVHVDGILKQPKCYEPFAPEIVGQTRKIILGKHSGTSSILAKLSELNIKYRQDNIPAILEQVKNKAIAQGGEVTDRDFVIMMKELNNDGDTI